MLVITLKRDSGFKLILPDGKEIMVLFKPNGISRNFVSIDAPKEVKIIRLDLLDEISP